MVQVSLRAEASRRWANSWKSPGSRAAEGSGLTARGAEPGQLCRPPATLHLLPGHGQWPPGNPVAPTGQSLAFFTDHLLLGLETDPPVGSR